MKMIREVKKIIKCNYWMFITTGMIPINQRMADNFK